MLHLPSVLLATFIGASVPQAESTARDSLRLLWLRDHVVPIRSIDPAHADSSDLLPLGRYLGPSRLVMLGEPSHVDGAVFLAQARLVRFLHASMGFDVLAWESGLFSCWRMDQALYSPAGIQEAMREGLFGVFARSGQLRSIFTYARSTHASPRPLEMAGFDIQFSTPTSAQSYRDALLAFVDRVDPRLLDADQRRVLDEFAAMANIFSEGPGQVTREGYARYRAFFRELSQALRRETDRLASVHRPRDVSLHLRFLENVRAMLVHWESLFHGPRAEYRDVAMGENLVWLARERYPDRKLIALGNTGHLSRAAHTIETMAETPAGEVVFRELGRQVYSIAFVRYAGAVGGPGREPVDLRPAPEGSLEALLHRLGQPYLFLDLRQLDCTTQHWLCGPLPHLVGTDRIVRVVWPEMFDGVVFIDRTFPSTTEGGFPRQ